VKPFIRFIWFGAVIMALGGLLAATDRRYRRPSKAGAAVTAPAGALRRT
jgi:cytochrome c-type biogenesis protein CcmF